MTLKRQNRVGGFTLIELLTVIVIVGILAAILIPVVGRVRQSAKASQGVGNMRQLAVAVLMLSNDTKTRSVMDRRMSSTTGQAADWVTPINESVTSLSAVRAGQTVFNDPIAQTMLIGDFGQTMFSMNQALTRSASTEQPKSLNAVRNPSRTVMLIDGRLEEPKTSGVQSGKTVGATLATVSNRVLAGTSRPDDVVPAGPDANSSEPNYFTAGSGNGYISWRMPGNKAKVAFLDGHVEVVPQGKLVRSNFDYSQQ